MIRVRPLLLSCVPLVVAFVLAIAAFAWMGYDFSTFSRVPIGDNRDPLLMSYFLEQSYTNLAHHPTQLGYSLIFYDPLEPNTFATTNAPYGLAIFMAPVYLLTGYNAITTLNLYMLLTFALTAWFATLWLRYVLEAPWWACILTGIAVAFVPWRFLELPRAEMLSTQWYFLCAYALHRLLNQPQLRWAVLLAVAFWLNLFTGTYIAFFFIIHAATFILYRLIRSEVYFPRRTLLAFIPIGIVFLMAAFPFLGFRFQQGGILQGHTFSEIQYLSARPLNWAQGASFIYYNLNGFEVEEKALFMGFVPLFLVFWGWRWRGPTPILRFALALVVLGYVLSLGPTLMLLEGVVLPMPYLLLMQIPGFSGMRVVSRYFLLAVVGGAILMTHAFVQIKQRLSPLASFTCIALLTILLMIEFVPYNGILRGRADDTYRILNRSTNVEPRALSQPAPFVPDQLNAWLAALPPETAVFNYPANKEHQYEYVFNQIFHHQPTLGGEASFNPAWYTQQDWARFPSFATLQAMQKHHIQYALVYKRWLTPEQHTAFLSNVKAFSNWLSYETTIDDVEIYRLLIPPPLTELTFDFDENVPGEGWQVYELTSDGKSFAWTKAETFTLYLPRLRSDIAFKIKIGLWGNPATPGTRETLTLTVNQHPIRLTYDPTENTLSGLIEAGIVGEEPVTLKWTTLATPHSPQALNAGDDRRRLGIAFDFVTMLPSEIREK